MVILADSASLYHQEDPAEATDPHKFPDGPCPALCLSSKTTYKRTKDRPTDGCNSPDSHGICSLTRGIYVRQRGPSGRKNWGAKEACQESKGKQHAEIGCQSGRDLEHDENEKSRKVDLGVVSPVFEFLETSSDAHRIPANLRYL